MIHSSTAFMIENSVAFPAVLQIRQRSLEFDNYSAALYGSYGPLASISSFPAFWSYIKSHRALAVTPCFAFGRVSRPLKSTGDWLVTLSLHFRTSMSKHKVKHGFQIWEFSGCLPSTALQLHRVSKYELLMIICSDQHPVQRYRI